jgi:hypothetical protein
MDYSLYASAEGGDQEKKYKKNKKNMNNKKNMKRKNKKLKVYENEDEVEAPLKSKGDLKPAKTTADNIQDLTSAISKPILIAPQPSEGSESAMEKARADAEHAELMKEGAALELCSLQEAEYEKAMIKISDLNSLSRPIPTWLAAKAAALQNRIE